MADREESIETWVWAAAWEVGAVWEVGVWAAGVASRGEARREWDGWGVWGVRGEGAEGWRLCPRCVCEWAGGWRGEVGVVGSREWAVAEACRCECGRPGWCWCGGGCAVGEPGTCNNRPAPRPGDGGLAAPPPAPAFPAAPPNPEALAAELVLLVPAAAAVEPASTRAPCAAALAAWPAVPLWDGGDCVRPPPAAAPLRNRSLSAASTLPPPPPTPTPSLAPAPIAVPPAPSRTPPPLLLRSTTPAPAASRPASPVAAADPSAPDVVMAVAVACAAPVGGAVAALADARGADRAAREGLVGEEPLARTAACGACEGEARARDPLACA